MCTLCIAPLVILALGAACDVPNAEIIDEEALQNAPTRTPVCHYNPNTDTYSRITVPAPALEVHLAHGDRLPDNSADLNSDCEWIGNFVTIHPPSAAAGTYKASSASFGPSPAGETGSVVPVGEACDPIAQFPADAIALVDRGTCTFVEKATNAQAVGAIAVIVVNNTSGAPPSMLGSDPNSLINIPVVMVSQNHGGIIEDNLPATGTVSAAEP